MKDEITISIKLASELLGVHEKTVRRMEKRGELSAVRTAGGHRRFKLVDIHQVCKERAGKKDASL